jgi:phosphatidylinositol-3-phosphatase
VRRRITQVALALALALPAGCAHARPGPPLQLGQTANLPRGDASRVVVVVMENREAGEVLGNAGAPYINSLARRYALARASYAVAHPSLPNYLALTSGSTHGVRSDCTSCRVRSANIVDQLEAAHISWRAYLEEVPAPCFTGAASGGYVKRHNPFAYYEDIVASPSRCARLVGFGRLARDLRSGRLPTFAWVTPNLCDDGHDCSLTVADRFLARTVPALLRELGPRGFLLLTWDEGTTARGCCGTAAGGGRVATIVAGPQVRAGAALARPIDHYGVLASIEEALGLPPLGAGADPRSGRLSSLFARPPRLTARGARRR